MLSFITIVGLSILLFITRDSKKYETIYSGNESDIEEATEYYWLLKNNKIPFSYQIPYNWRNLYQLGYKKCPLYIKVNKDYMDQANELMMYYRIEKRKRSS